MNHKNEKANLLYKLGLRYNSLEREQGTLEMLLILIDEVRERLTENDQKNSEILDQFYTDNPEFVVKDSAKLMPVFMYKYMIKEMTTSEQLQPVMDDYKRRLEAQSNTINALAALIPSMALSGSP